MKPGRGGYSAICYHTSFIFARAAGKGRVNLIPVYYSIDRIIYKIGEHSLEVSCSGYMAVHGEYFSGCLGGKY